MIVTGIQPTGNLHLGNYLGAIRPLVGMQEPNNTIVFIADYHAITMPHNPEELRENSVKLAAMLIACGVNPNDTILFRQSEVSAHTELAWILQCTASRFGWLARMAQFRSKSNIVDQLPLLKETMAEITNTSWEGDDAVIRIQQLAAMVLADLSVGENTEGPSVGLFTYPVLQAADVLLYQADIVPVGDDQSQHMNLAIDIGEKFNREFGNVFTIPRPVTAPGAARIMSLYSAKHKMSKSDPNDNHRINLNDDPTTIAKKIKTATSDSALIPDNLPELAGRAELSNLLNIWAAITGDTLADTIERFAGKGYGILKPALTEALVEHLRPIQATYVNLLSDRTFITEVLHRGQGAANIVANGTLNQAKNAIGVV